MPTVIDALIVTLGLDPSNFTQAQKDAAEALDVFDRKVNESSKLDFKREQEKRLRERENRLITDRARRDEEKKISDAEKSKSRLEKDEINARKKETDAKARAEKEARAKQVKEEREAARERAEGFKLARDAALGFGAAIAALGVEKLITGTAIDIANLSRASHNLGMSTDEVAAWGQAIEKSVGGSASDALGTLQNVSGMLVRMRTMGDMSLVGLTNSLEKFGHKQFNMNGPDGKPIGAEDFLKEIAGYSNRMDPKQYSELLSRYGIDQGTINFLEQGPGKVNSDIAEQYKNGHLPTKSDEDQAKALQAETVALTQAFQGLERQLTFSFAPDITRFMKDLASFVKLITGNESWSQFQADRKKSWHESVVSRLIGKGLSPEEAEKKANEGDSGDDTPSKDNAAPNNIWFKIPSRSLSYGDAKAPAPLTPDVEAFVRQDAVKRGIDPEIAVALFKTEGGGYNKVSSAGAFGPAQLMPGTAKDLGVASSVNEPGYNWKDNADAGIRYYASLLALLKSNKAAQAAYNAGPNNPGVQYFSQTGDTSHLPIETQKYLKSIQSATAPGANAAAVSTANNDNSSSNETNIGEVHVHGVDTNNAHAVGRAIRPVLGGQSDIANSDMGMV